MKYTRKWRQGVAPWREIAKGCQSFTDDGWTVHTILPTTHVGERNADGAIIVAFKDEPDLSGGVPR